MVNGVFLYTLLAFRKHMWHCWWNLLHCWISLWKWIWTRTWSNTWIVSLSTVSIYKEDSNHTFGLVLLTPSLVYFLRNKVFIIACILCINLQHYDRTGQMLSFQKNFSISWGRSHQVFILSPDNEEGNIRTDCIFCHLHNSGSTPQILLQNSLCIYPQNPLFWFSLWTKWHSKWPETDFFWCSKLPIPLLVWRMTNFFVEDFL